MKDRQNVQQELTKALKRVEARLDELESRIADLSCRMEVVEVAMPSELRALSATSIEQAITENPYVTFEVLADCTFAAGIAFRKGDHVRADLYPYLVDYVRSGLMLGIPQDQSEHVRKLREQAKAQLEYAQAQLAAAKAAAARAEVELASVEAEDTAADVRAAAH